MRESWEIKKLKDIGKVQTGTTPSTKDATNYGSYIPFVKPAHFQKNGVIDSKESMLSESGLAKGRLFGANSVLMVCIGATIGKTGFTTIPVSSNQQINALTPKNDCDSKFIYYGMVSSEFQREVLKVGTSSQATLPIINKTKWENLILPIPPLTEQKQIVAILNKVFATIDQAKANLEKNIENAKELFQSKLNEIFSQKGDGWEEKKWSEVLEIKSGRNQKEVENPNGKYPIIGSAGKTMGFTNEYICEEGTTIIGRKGTINNPMLIESKFWNVDTAFGLHALEGLDKKFLYFFCLSYDFTERDKGSGRPSLVKKDLLKMIMPIPSLNIQAQTVAKCEGLKKELFGLEEFYHKKIRALEELKKSILQKAFAGELTEGVVV